MGHLEGRRLRVVGGGVAGLAVAIAVSQRGGKVRLLEQAAEIEEVGAGLQISPNGMRVIDALGLGDALRRVSMAADAVQLSDGLSGQDVLRLPLGGAEYRLVHRARLIEVLHTAAVNVGVNILLGAHGETSDTLTLAADGVHSMHRLELNGAREPEFSGQVAWRALIDDTPNDVQAQVFMGPGRHLVSYPLQGGVRNIVAVVEEGSWAPQGWHYEASPDKLRVAFEDFGGPVPAWLSRVKRVMVWGLFVNPVAKRWYNATTALLGDAAHPMLPFLAQGANMALEDAWVLARCLDEEPEIERAFAKYQTARQARAKRVMKAAQANARNYHLSGAKRIIAHSALRVGGRIAPQAPLRRFDWLYQHDVTK